jgi:hypothetical protein
MNRTDLATAATTFAGQLAGVTMTDGSYMVYVINGNINSKGLVVRNHADEPVFYLAPTKIASINAVDEDDVELITMNDLGDPSDEPEIMEINNEDTEADEMVGPHDGMTTRELAALVGTYPKALRVVLRSLGLGVGKGRKYSLSASAFDLVKLTIAESDKA